MDGWKNGLMDGWMGGLMGEWMDGKMDDKLLMSRPILTLNISI